MMYALLGIGLFAVPAILGLGAWMISTRDLKKFREERAEILKRIQEDEAIANAKESVEQTIAHPDETPKNTTEIEREAFRKSSRSIPKPANLSDLAATDAALYVLKENGDTTDRIWDDHHGGFSWVIVNDEDGETIKFKLASQRHNVNIATFAERVTFNKAIIRHTTSGLIVPQGGIKAKGRKKSVFVPGYGDDNKDAG
jgi:hypothetical protein